MTTRPATTTIQAQEEQDELDEEQEQKQELEKVQQEQEGNAVNISMEMKKNKYFSTGTKGVASRTHVYVFVLANNVLRIHHTTTHVLPHKCGNNK